MHRIVVAYDGSESARRALSRVAELARNGDLVVVGTGDKNALERFLLGSVSDKVAHRASCDVLVVR